MHQLRKPVPNAPLWGFAMVTSSRGNPIKGATFLVWLPQSINPLPDVIDVSCHETGRQNPDVTRTALFAQDWPRYWFNLQGGLFHLLLPPTYSTNSEGISIQNGTLCRSKRRTVRHPHLSTGMHNPSTSVYLHISQATINDTPNLNGIDAAGNRM